jgi:EAL domain-containing protein (putative c-di-GMP-specific phosphodiesterase class I)
VRLFTQWSRLGLTWQHKRLIAIAVGVVFAGVSLVAFDVWLNGLIVRQTQEEATVLTSRAIVLAETRITRMRQAVFDTTPVKDIALLAGDGQVLCSHVGRPIGEQEVLVSEPLFGEAGFFLDVVRIGSSREQFVRLRLPGKVGPESLVALIPSKLFLPTVSSESIAASVFTEVRTRGGVLLAESAAGRDSLMRQETVTARARSDRYGFAATAISPIVRAASPYRDLDKISLFLPGAIAVLLMAGAALIPRRQPPNPVADLQRAIEAGEFVPYYQPIVDIRSGRLLGAEILARWKKPDGSLVMPGVFLPLAESSGLIVDMTYQLMRRVCAEAGAAIGARPGFRISFNFTAKLFASPTIVRDVRKIFAGSPIGMSQLIFEITEREPLDDLSEARVAIAALQGLGARIAIDDVGTGHSGLSYMLKLGVDIIKIDKMFVDAIGSDRNSNTIVETLVDLAHNMRMDVIAEGVENFEQVAHLRELGIRSAQGYVFAPPLPPSAFLQLMEAIEPVQTAETITLAAAASKRASLSARPRLARG